MSTAQQILIGYGTVVLLVGFVLGTALGMLRPKHPTMRNLATAHVETLMQSSMHFGLAFAIGATAFDGRLATWGAVLIAVGSGMQALGVTSNWLTGTGDQFAEKSPGLLLNSASTFVIWPGAAILAWGILTGI